MFIANTFQQPKQFTVIVGMLNQAIKNKLMDKNLYLMRNNQNNGNAEAQQIPSNTLSSITSNKPLVLKMAIIAFWANCQETMCCSQVSTCKISTKWLYYFWSYSKKHKNGGNFSKWLLFKQIVKKQCVMFSSMHM